MSKSIYTTAEPIELPSKVEMNQWMNELEQRGVTAELRCGECGTPTKTRVLIEEKDDENQKTICRSCATDHLRKVGELQNHPISLLSK